MIKCLKCGSILEDKSNFCPYCGGNLTTSLQDNPHFICKHKDLIISSLLAVFLPGFSYFYLGLFKRGILFYLSIMSIFLVLAVKGGFYTGIETVNTQILAIIFVLVVFLIYLYQIYDVVQKTKLINEGLIRFLK